MPFVSPFLLGLVQGLTEFLPISSSGHLVLAEALLDYREPGLLLVTVVHIATTLAVIIYFRQRFLALARGALHDGDSRWLILMLTVAFVVTSIIGLGLELSGVVDRLFHSPALAGVMLLVTALALLSMRWLKTPPEAEAPARVTWKVALLVGVAQGIAIFPGISRSGFTIVAGLWGGLGRNSAAEFSFLLSVPTIMAAALFSLVREADRTGGVTLGILVAGVVAFVSGLLAIHWLMRWLQRGRLWWFSGYCAVIGVAALLVWGLGLPSATSQGTPGSTVEATVVVATPTPEPPATPATPATPTPEPTLAPALSITPEPSPTDPPFATPLPVREWDLVDLAVAEDTVAVTLRVYVGISVTVTLDGRAADRVDHQLPLLEFVFQDVSPGPHTALVEDVVGHREEVDLVVP